MLWPVYTDTQAFLFVCSLMYNKTSMEHIDRSNELPKFSSPEEELQYLRERVASIEKSKAESAEKLHPDAAVSQAVHEYVAQLPKAGLEEHEVASPEYEKVVGYIKELSHRERMREFYEVLAQKGIAAAVKYSRAADNPHFEDDFHRVLVGYVKTGAVIPGLDREKELERDLRRTVYQVTLPYAGTKDEKPDFQDVVSGMERFYGAMFPTLAQGTDGTMTVEISMENFSLDVVFYVSVPDGMRDIFTKQLFAVFPTANLREDKGDYNIFNEFGTVAGGYATPSGTMAYPIDTGDERGSDPLKVLVNAFSKIDRDGEGAAIQIVLQPDKRNILGKYKTAVAKLRQGAPVKATVDVPLGIGGELVKTFGDLFRSTPDPKKQNEQLKAADDAERQKAIERIEEKTKKTLVISNVRILASAGNSARANEIYAALEAAFHQFQRPDGNGFKFKKVSGSRLERLIYDFTYREFESDEAFILNLGELAHIYHFPEAIAQHEAPQLKAVGAASAPAPAELPKEGTLIGVNKYRGEKRDIYSTPKDRLRHFYVIGQTGTGKSSLLKNMAVEDIKAGRGVCFIDPHGTDVQDILSTVPKERIDDVIYFDPSYTPRPFGLNMLEYDTQFPELKIFVVNELLSIFKKLYASTPEAMGPAFEQYFRNATMLVLEDPETGNTLLEISRVLADVKFRELKLSRCKNPIVVQFWRDIASKTSGEAGLANMIPYITNKFDVFLSNDIMRPIIAQEESSFNFRYIMDNKKILLVNLSKGRLGDINANLIGLILVGKILMAALSRVDSFGQQLPDFYLYIDEFQNITTDSISSILSEARKYGLSLNVAHQFIAQLDPKIKDAVFGNVGNMAAFRVGPEDAEFLETQFAPVFTAQDLMKVENYNCFVKMLMNGKPVPPFSLATYPPPTGNPEIVEQVKQLSYLKYGRDRKDVDDAIMKKYLSQSQAALAGAVPAKPAATGAPAPAPQDGRVPLAQVAFPSRQMPPTPPQVPPAAAQPSPQSVVSAFVPQTPATAPLSSSPTAPTAPISVSPASPPRVQAQVLMPSMAPSEVPTPAAAPTPSPVDTPSPYAPSIQPAIFQGMTVPQRPVASTPTTSTQYPTPQELARPFQQAFARMDIAWQQDAPPAGDFTVEDAVHAALRTLKNQKDG